MTTKVRMPDPAKFRRAVIAAVRRSQNSGESPGFCINCGDEASGVEPDACEHVCDSCGEPQVYGAEELLLMGDI